MHLYNKHDFIRNTNDIILLNISLIYPSYPKYISNELRAVFHLYKNIRSNIQKQGTSQSNSFISVNTLT